VEFGALTKVAYELGARRYLAEFWYDGTDHWRQTLVDNSNFLRAFLDQAEAND
jgi:hypothetical protein